MAGLLASSLETAKLGENGFEDVGTGPGSPEGKYINFLTVSDQAGSVREDVERIALHPLVPKTIPVRGFIYDVKSGPLEAVPGAEANVA